MVILISRQSLSAKGGGSRKARGLFMAWHPLGAFLF